MRKLATGDVFAFCRCLKKLGVKYVQIMPMYAPINSYFLCLLKM